MRQSQSRKPIQRRWFLSIFFLALFCSVALSQGLQPDSKAVERSREFEKYFSAAAQRHGIDARLLWVIGYLETRFNTKAMSRKGARGLMQLMPATAARFGASDPHDPIAAIDAAARYLRYLSNRFDGRLNLILAAYNAGEATVESFLAGRSIRSENKIINPAGRKTGGIPPYRETQSYVATGLRLLSGIPHPAGEIIAKNQVVKVKPQANPNSLSLSGRKSVSYAASLEEKASISANSTRRTILY